MGKSQVFNEIAQFGNEQRWMLKGKVSSHFVKMRGTVRADLVVEDNGDFVLGI